MNHQDRPQDDVTDRMQDAVTYGALAVGEMLGMDGYAQEWQLEAGVRGDLPRLTMTLVLVDKEGK